MTSFSNSFIDNYIKRVTELNQNPQRIPSEAELEKLAEDLGINSAEIESAKKKSEAHFIRAQGYMRLKHWDDAIEELNEAIAFCPCNEELLLSLAHAHLERWTEKHRRDDAENVRLRVKDCLFLQPNSEEALNLLAKLDKARQQRKTFWVSLVIGLGSFLTISSFLWLYPKYFNYSWLRQAEQEDKLEQLEERLLAEIELLQQEQEQLRKQVQSSQTREASVYRNKIAELDESLRQLKKVQQAWYYQFHNRYFREGRN